jgi:hypothetical protein
VQLPPLPPHISAALADADPANPIARSVADALQTYSARFEESVRRNGGFSLPITLPKPRDDYEAAALALFMTQLKTSQPAIAIRIAADNDDEQLH